MKVMYLSQHFPPEIGAAQGRAYDMAKNLVKLGHEVTVLTAFPNNKASSKLFKKEYIDGITVYRSFVVKDTKTGAVRRIANYMSFMISSLFSGLFAKKPDVVLATSPQLFVGLAGYVLSRIYRKNFVFEVRDLWVDFAQILGQVNNKRMLKWARKIERFLYKRADRIVVVTHGYKKRLIAQGLPESKIEVITNGVDPDSINIAHGTNTNIRKKYSLGKKLVFLYAGNIGAAQGLDVVLKAAEKLLDEVDVHFMLVGEGVEKNRLKKWKKDSNLTNVTFVDGKTKKELMDYYEAADMCLITLKDHELFKITIPSKVFDCMIMDKPILIGVDGEAKQIVEGHEAGLFFKPEDTDDLLRAINEVHSNPELINSMEKNIQKSVLTSFNRKNLAEKLAWVLSKN